jgi:hypothetical protein
MPEHGDERTELESGAEVPPVRPSKPSDEPTEFQPDTSHSGDRERPAEGTLPPLPAPPAISPASLGDRTERTPTAEGPPASPRTLPRRGDDRTELTGPGKSTGRTLPSEVQGYRLVERLGAGTYGEVWLAEEERTGIRVAVKFLAHGTGLEWQLIQAEVKQLALLHADPGIVQLLDVELEATPPYYIMAYAEQGSLARRLEQGPLPVAEALAIFRQLTDALSYVHAKGVRHCDLKPGNILLNARRRVLVADFGQAHLSSEACPALGTFFYMAPEQADVSRQIPDSRWDVYGLGAIFYAMLTGHPPRESAEARAELARTPDLGERLTRYREWVARAPRPEEHRRVHGMDRRLVEIIDRCLEVDPNRRLHDAGAVQAALERREHHRRQRPLLVFGFIAQVLLFLLMGGAAVWAAASAVRRSEAALIQQLLDSDRVTASLLAGGLERELSARQNLLERCANEPEVRAAAANRDRKGLQELLKRFNRRQAVRVLGWIITDETGHLLAHDVNVTPPAGFKMPDFFGWRDWFNGQGDYFGADREKKVFSPITRTHISQPFQRRFKPELAVGLSTPVFAPGSKKVVGVLYTPVRMHDVDSWLDPVKIKDGFAVLVDHRGYCLRHPVETAIWPGPDRNPPRWKSPTFEAAVKSEGGTPEHVDPINGRLYLASYAPLRQVGWGAVVQHERSAALQPIDALRTQLLYVGLGLLLGVPLLLSVLWSWLIWTLRRKERLPQG